MKKFISKNAAETQAVALELGLQILNTNIEKSAVVLALSGELGAGKTTFLQGFAKGLGIKEKILSPTFIIMRKFKIPPILKPHDFNNQRPLIIKVQYFYHLDCYRLKNEMDLEGLGFKEIISNPENIVAIEWPERIKKILPKKVIKITFKHKSENTRTLIIRE